MAPSDNSAPSLSPPLKWAGGKRWLLPHLRPLWQASDASRLVEPFCGGLAVALGLNPPQALLNDVNPHLIHFYQALQRGLALDDPALQNDRAAYEAARARFNALIDAGAAQSIEAARLFYYLNRTGYNGLCRFNRSGRFNVPFGRYKTIAYARDFASYAPTLRRWSFTCADFADLDPLRPDDFLYADPPYDAPFTQYSQGGFSWADQERLAEWLAAAPCPTVVSNQATERVLALYHRLGFEIALLDAPRRIACTGNRASAREMLAVRNLPPSSFIARQ
ncbi:MAG: Dam family site-specific DNA-(adenine-N6)-methyltransferase [Vampirovibrionales bacterium]|nr:Dam family site-specific DNA-(adenine-N6)-methyltransferase [Vampirovibrionales bacterium]